MPEVFEEGCEGEEEKKQLTSEQIDKLYTIVSKNPSTVQSFISGWMDKGLDK